MAEEKKSTAEESQDVLRSSQEVKFNWKNKKLLLPAALIASLLIIAGLYLAIASNKNAKVNDARQKTYQALKEANYQKAQDEALKGITINSKDKYLVKGFIDATTAQGNLTGKEKEALKTVEPYIKILSDNNNNDVDSLISIGYAYEAAGDYEKALTYYEKAISIDPKSSAAYFHKGHTLAFLNRRNESQLAYDKSYELDPNNAAVNLVKARDLMEQGENNEAMKLLLRIGENTKIDSELRAGAYSDCVFLKMNQNQISDARECAAKAVQIDKNFSLSLGLQGYLTAIKDPSDYYRGVKAISEAIKLNPRISLNYHLLGIIMRMNAYYQQAIALQKEAISRIPEDNTLVGISEKSTNKVKMEYELAQTYSLTNDIPNTIKYLKQAFSENRAYKQNIQTDISKGYFKKIINEPDFIALIN